jgi:SpoVK/Ycf46/Vps4 family AAA+-type ATPase
MSGIDPSDGVLVMVTANNVSRIDGSIGEFDENGVSSRPGRLDISLEFKDLNEDCRRTIANKILHGLSAEKIEEVILSGAGETGAQFTKRCSDLVLKNYWETVDLKTNKG